MGGGMVAVAWANGRASLDLVSWRRRDLAGAFLLPFFQAEDGIRDFCLSRGLGDVYKRQGSGMGAEIACGSAAHAKKRNPGRRARLPMPLPPCLHPPGTDSCRKAEATTGSWCALGTHWHYKLSWHSRPRSVYIGTHLH